jgi:rhamnosyltransferase
VNKQPTSINISIVVPVKNGIKTLPNLIKAVQQQTMFQQMEIVVIDSGSEDGSVEFLQKYDFVRLFQIEPQEFNHGGTRNLAVQKCEGEFIWMTVQDAWPTDSQMLAKMIKHFEDQDVVAVCGQQIVPQDPKMNPHEWFRSTSEPQIYKINYHPEVYQNLSPKQKWEVATIDNVNTLYRKATLIANPFNTVFWGEDMFWGDNVVGKGLAIVFDRSAKVNHYHYQDANYTLQQTLITKLVTYNCFSFVDDRTFDVKQYFLVVYRNLKWKLNLKWIFYNFRLIYNHRKATKLFLKYVSNNSLDRLEKQLLVNLPMGKQSG